MANKHGTGLPCRTEQAFLGFPSHRGAVLMTVNWLRSVSKTWNQKGLPNKTGGCLLNPEEYETGRHTKHSSQNVSITNSDLPARLLVETLQRVDVKPLRRKQGSAREDPSARFRASFFNSLIEWTRSFELDRLHPGVCRQDPLYRNHEKSRTPTSGTWKRKTRKIHQGVIHFLCCMRKGTQPWVKPYTVKRR